MRDLAVIPRCPCSSPVTRPQEQQVLLHFITGGILPAHVGVPVGHFLPCLGEGLVRGGTGCRSQASNTNILPNIDNHGKRKKKITVPSANNLLSSVICLFLVQLHPSLTQVHNNDTRLCSLTFRWFHLVNAVFGIKCQWADFDYSVSCVH